MKATLTRSGATGYSTANWKSYDVWGGERASTGSGSMFGYGGNLGHPTDPENGLIYMRARFYEPWTGRFLSEDTAKDGFNWYIYASNAASASVDITGKSAVEASYALLTAFFAWVLLGTTNAIARGPFLSQVGFVALWLGLREGGGHDNASLKVSNRILGIFAACISILACDKAIADYKHAHQSKMGGMERFNAVTAYWLQYGAFLGFFMELEDALQSFGL